MIEKTAINEYNGYNKLYFYDSARMAEQDLLHCLKEQGKYTLLLPAYIGFSANEGSGIYDPVIAERVEHVFYRLDKKLNVVLEDLNSKLCSIAGKKVVLLVHYFGYIDPNISSIVQMCNRDDVILVEDCAHALYTDYIDHSCGFYGDYALFSLHKMLPFKNGGMMRENSIKATGLSPEQTYRSPFDYNFYQIALTRKNNTRHWLELLNDNSTITPLRSEYDGITPQTLPVIINGFDRNELYFKINEGGFGLVSLYHTMIEPIAKGDYVDAQWVSKHITNLPVHQDISFEQIDRMFDCMKDILKI